MSVRLIPALESAKPTDGQQSLKLRNAARDFEAQLLAELLQQMQPQSSLLPGSGSSAGSEQYEVMATQAVAGAMADAGGIGLSKYLIHQMGSEKI
ncbi:MAG TPA: rod-binding protein [Terriglobales bacterium]|jgi:Rod binding domain-containing protein|nr:rod-binding protein [Terriglobales bacterium]